MTATTSPLASPRKTSPLPGSSLKSSHPQVSPRQQKETIVVGPGNQTWGPPRLVELQREPGKTLGISIVGRWNFSPSEIKFNKTHKIREKMPHYGAKKELLKHNGVQ